MLLTFSDLRMYVDVLGKCIVFASCYCPLSATWRTEPLILTKRRKVSMGPVLTLLIIKRKILLPKWLQMVAPLSPSITYHCCILIVLYKPKTIKLQSKTNTFFFKFKTKIDLQFLSIKYYLINLLC